MVNDRSFGIEIECLVRGGWTNARNLFRDAGFEEKDWVVGTDASLPSNTGVEIRSPILRGREGMKEMKNVVSFMKESGFYVSRACGLHIHHDAPEFKGYSRDAKENTKRLVNSWAMNQKKIDRMVHTSRVGNRYCSPWSEKELRDLNNCDDGYYYASKTRTLNIQHLNYGYGTIEIRQHESTIDADEIEAWILFGQKFINNCLKRKRNIPEMVDTETLLSRIKAPVRVVNLYSQKDRNRNLA